MVLNLIRTLDCWMDDKNFEKFMAESWEQQRVQGRGAFILKQKLKVMKACLRGWNHNHFGDIHQNIAIIERDMNDLEKKKERGLQEEFWRNVLYRESLLKQKSRAKWLREGYLNSKYFHIMANWRRKNMIRGVMS